MSFYRCVRMLLSEQYQRQKFENVKIYIINFLDSESFSKPQWEYL